LRPQASGRPRRNATKWVAIVAALNIAFGMAFSVVTLRRDGDRHRDIAAHWRDISGRIDVQQSLLLGTNTSPHLHPSLQNAVAAQNEPIARELKRLVSLQPQLETDVRATRYVNDHLRLVNGDDLDTTPQAEMAGHFDDYQPLLSAAADAHSLRGAESTRTADIELILMMGVAGLIAVLLHKRILAARASAQRLARQEREQSEARFRSLVQHSKDVILICTPSTAITYQSPSASVVLGHPYEELAQLRLVDLVHPNDAGRLRAFIGQLSADSGDAPIIEWRLQRSDGSFIYVESAARNLLEDPNVGGLVLTLRNVSAHKALESQLRHQAFHDSLTELANRALFGDRVEHALTRTDRADTDIAVLFVDLDDFKTINDSLGHSAGDELLIEVARRLRQAVRPADTVARLGGDEFAILLEDLAGDGDATAVATRIQEQLDSPITLDERELTVRASIGIAIGGTREEGADELLRNADMAMYMAKRSRKTGYAVFEPVMHEAALERLETRAALERAIVTEDFRIHYQPIIDLHKKTVSGVEALVRWKRNGVLVPPAQFIPLAEETGLIHQLGAWVLKQACMTGRSWQRRHPLDPPLSISVNVSAQQVLQSTLVDAVKEALDESGLAPEKLTLEITESDLMVDTEEILDRFNALKKLGVRIAIDDFGTGYSSLSYLGRFPVDVLKIDRSFMSTLTDEGDPSLADAIVELGHRLSLEVVAEGIERRDQLQALRTLHCAHGQGFYFSPPLAEWGIEELLAHGPQRLPQPTSADNEIT